MSLSRRYFIKSWFIGSAIIAISPKLLLASTNCQVPHPLSPPASDLQGSCDNCGMKRPLWARTWHTFKLGDQSKNTCSIHCLAEMSHNSGIKPRRVVVAEYLNPYNSFPAENGYYVIGSSARGTMTMKSKIAFTSHGEAEKFAKSCGGSVGDFQAAYSAALSSLAAENTMIQKKRIAKGKIVEPADGDLCPVCGMHPVKYPKNKCQIITPAGEAIHFCATQCLVEYMESPKKYRSKELEITSVWVIDYSSGRWINGHTAYYVTGTDVRGPMGKEAFPFANHKSATDFAKKQAGSIFTFDKLTMSRITS